MDYKNIVLQLEKKEFKNIYFLHGEEEYFIDLLVRYFENKVLNNSEKAFNQIITYGKDLNASQLTDYCIQLPMMAPYRMIIVKEAQSMRSLPDMDAYINNPAPQTILVFAHKHKKMDGRTNFAKNMKRSMQSVIFESKRLKENAVPNWVVKYMAEKELKIDLDAAQLVAEYMGNDLSRISNEMGKLAIQLAGKTEVKKQDIEDNIGISKDYNVFELQKALGKKSRGQIAKIIQYMAANMRTNPIQMIIGLLYSYYSKLFVAKSSSNGTDASLMKALNLNNTYFLGEYKSALRNYSLREIKNAIHTLKQYDLKSKGVGNKNMSDRDMFAEMIYKLIN